MTHKQQMLAVLSGEPVARIPWVPRLDLWYAANHRAGTLPPEYHDASLIEIVDDLDWGYHAVVPLFKDLRSAEDDVHRPLGIYNLHSMPYKTVLEGVTYRSCEQGDKTIVEYQTPLGPLTTVTVYDEAMRRAGISITHVEKHAFSEPQDYGPLGYLFEHARVEPNYEGYTAFARSIGDRGFAAAFLSLAASPMHLIQRELMPLDRFFFEMNDHPKEINSLAEKIGRYWDRVLRVSADCPAEVFFLGANYDAAVQYPPFFRDHIRPVLAEFAEMLHAKGKYLLTHTDGENSGLLEHYLDAHFDIADSICPDPMTKLSMGDVRKAFDGRISIMGGIPSIALLKQSMHDDQFETFLDNFFDQIGKGDRLLLGISDTTPPGADFQRLKRVAQRIEQFGPVKP